MSHTKCYVAYVHVNVRPGTGGIYCLTLTDQADFLLSEFRKVGVFCYQSVGRWVLFVIRVVARWVRFIHRVYQGGSFLFLEFMKVDAFCQNNAYRYMYIEKSARLRPKECY